MTAAHNWILASDAVDIDGFACAAVWQHRLRQHNLPATVILPIAGEQLRWRCDLAALLDYLQQKGWQGDYCCQTTLPEGSLQGSWHLLDRHRLPLNWPAERLQQRIVTIIDHRHDRGTFTAVADRQIENVASCATLVYERSRSELAAAQKLLLAAAIFLDSNNLQSKKTSTRDRQALAALTHAMPTEEQRLLTRLQYLRYNPDTQLNSRQLLQQDLKWLHAGTVAVPLPVVHQDAASFWQRQDSSAAAWQLAQQAKPVPCLLILHKSTANNRRYLSLLIEQPWPGWLTKLLGSGLWVREKTAQQLLIFYSKNAEITRKDLLADCEDIIKIQDE